MRVHLSTVYHFKALPRLVEDGGRSVGKEEKILLIISVVLLNDGSEAIEDKNSVIYNYH